MTGSKTSALSATAHSAILSSGGLDPRSAQSTSSAVTALQHGGASLITAGPTVTDVTTGQTYNSIQAAVDAANSGDTLQLSAGTFNENVTNDGKSLTIDGANQGVNGTGARGAESIIVGGLAWTGGTGVLDGVRFEDMTVQNNHADVSVTGGDLAISHDVFFSDVVGGGSEMRAVYVGGGSAEVTNDYVTGSHASGFSGASFQRGVWYDGDLGSHTHLTISGTEFENTRSAINGDVNGDSTLDVNGNTFHNDGTATALGYTNVGTTFEANTYSAVGDEFNFKNFTTGANFDAHGAVTSSDTPVVVLGSAHADNITGTDGDDYLQGNDIGGGTASDSLTGGAGNDTLVSGGEDKGNASGTGADVFNGGSGNDTIIGAAGSGSIAQYAGVQGHFTITQGSPGAITVTDSTAAEGTDTLTGVSKLQFADHAVLIVGDGGYSTIQAAINAAHDGDTIMVASGTYQEQDSVNGLHGLTIEAMAGATVNIVAPTSGMTASGNDAVTGREQYSVLTVTNSTDVNIVGITVDGNDQAGQVTGGDNYDGIFYNNSSGGLTDVDVIGVQDSTFSGIQRGVGILVTDDPSAARLDFSMDRGAISGFQKNAAVFRHANLDIGSVTVTGAGATSITAQNGFQASDSTGAFHGNWVSGIGYDANPGDGSYSGEFLLYDNPSLDVLNNTIVGTNGSDTLSRDVGVYVFGENGAAMGGTISGNVISYTDIGIGAYDNLGGGFVVSGNNISHLDSSDSGTGGGLGIDFEPTTTGNYGVPDNTITTPFNVTGTVYNDFIVGGGGNDTLSGGTDGADTLIGGGGNDTYYARHGVTMIEQASEGVDTVVSAGTFTLADNFENLTLTGHLKIDGTGNAEDNVILGNAGKNTLEGLDGNDSLNGGSGRDTLGGGAGNDTLDGGASAKNHLDGGDGSDNLISNGFKDLLTGGDGSDTFTFTGLSAKAAATITDFSLGETVDLSALGVHQVSHFDGGVNEFRVIEQNGHTVISFDMDGSGKADHSIVLSGGDFTHAGDISFII